MANRWAYVQKEQFHPHPPRFEGTFHYSFKKWTKSSTYSLQKIHCKILWRKGVRKMPNRFKNETTNRSSPQVSDRASNVQKNTFQLVHHILRVHSPDRAKKHKDIHIPSSNNSKKSFEERGVRKSNRRSKGTIWSSSHPEWRTSQSSFKRTNTTASTKDKETQLLSFIKNSTFDVLSLKNFTYEILKRKGVRNVGLRFSGNTPRLFTPSGGHYSKRS